MDFREGQRVRCVVNRPWASILTGESAAGPANGEICTISKVRLIHAGPQVDGMYLSLAGWDDMLWYFAEHFRPLEDREFERLEALLAGLPALRVGAGDLERVS